MIFIETPVFEEDIQRLMPDETYAEFQQYLADHPDAGDVIQDTGGIRKVRWNLPGTGKRGGVRVIYYWRVAEDQILMLLAYKKAKQSDLTHSQKRALKTVVENLNG
ncbi:MAG: type II toxin-antitoxin system RelE/ParE family toxin [Steroidobacteraceae bacterium]